MNKIIFLDIDGVLAIPGYFSKRTYILNRGVCDFDSECVNNLNKITDATGAKIVLSSSWRIDFWDNEEMNALRNWFKVQGVNGEIIDHTPYFGEFRGNEIQDWLTNHPDVKKFVIIDDSSDMEHLTQFLVQTVFEIGLQESDANLAIDILNK